MTAASAKAGRVTKLSDVRGLMEYRFVPKGWTAPPEFPHLTWFEFDPIKHADEYAKWQADMHARMERLRAFNGEVWDFTASWYKDRQPVYTTRIDFDPVERPVLVVIGNFQ